MSIAISLDVSAVPANPAGAGRYILSLAGALGRRDDLALYLWARSSDGRRWREVAPSAHLEPVVPDHRPLRLAWEQARLPQRLSRLPSRLHHGPHYTMPQAARVARVVTVHDLTFFNHPEWHQRAKVVFFRRAIRLAARHADALVCVSASTASRLQAVCQPRGEVVVIGHGVDRQRFCPEEPPGQSDHDTLARMGVKTPFVAFVGTIEPRKDVATLVRAFDRMAGAHAGLNLVLAGSPGWGTGPVDEAIATARHRKRIMRVGYVSDDAVPALLRRAAAVAYPSLEEGFGLPVLEALACGSPLVTTTGSAMEELSEGAAVLVRPGDVDGLAGVLDTLVRNDASLGARRARGLDVAARHSWDQAAEAHVQLYRSVLQRREALG